MAKKQAKESVENLGTLSSPKTNQDFNKKKPSTADPNELKSKTNPEKNKVADEIKKHNSK